MHRRKILITVLIMTFLSILACAGGTSGSVRGSSQSCQWGGSGGECDGSIDKLSGTYGIDIENDDILSGDSIDVLVEVSVGSGVLNVSLEDPDGKLYSVQVPSNSMKTLLGVAEGEFSAFEVTFEAVDGDVEDITWFVSYQIR